MKSIVGSKEHREERGEGRHHSFFFFVLFYFKIYRRGCDEQSGSIHQRYDEESGSIIRLTTKRSVQSTLPQDLSSET